MFDCHAISVKQRPHVQTDRIGRADCGAALRNGSAALEPAPDGIRTEPLQQHADSFPAAPNAPGSNSTLPRQFFCLARPNVR
jgi:hypothetical protein